MPSPIDCSLMSHASCFDLRVGEEPVEPEAPTEPEATARASSYACVNECVSALGVSTLVGGAVTSLGCLVVSAGSCAVLIGAAVGSTLGACDAACEELESKP
jgi:hypothetical protein